MAKCCDLGTAAAYQQCVQRAGAPEQRASAAPSSSESPLSATARRGAGAGAAPSSSDDVFLESNEHQTNPDVR